MAKPNLKVISSSIRISVTSKLDGIRSWSLQAIDTCPGSLGSDGKLVAACLGCYATTGNYRFSNVKAHGSITSKIGSVKGGKMTW